MATELRKSGIGIVGEMPWGTHFCQFYDTRHDLLTCSFPISRPAWRTMKPVYGLFQR